MPRYNFNMLLLALPSSLSLLTEIWLLHRKRREVCGSLRGLLWHCSQVCNSCCWSTQVWDIVPPKFVLLSSQVCGIVTIIFWYSNCQACGTPALRFAIVYHSVLWWGLLDRSTALYFYKQLKRSLHKPRGNLLENLFSKKCAFKNNLQLLENKFCLKQIQHLKMAFYLAKWPIFKNLQYYINW